MSCSCHPEPEPRPRGVSRRMMVAGGLAAGLAPFVPKVAGAQDVSFGGAGSDPATTTTTEPGLEGIEADAPSASRDYSFLPPRPANEKYVRPMMFPVLPDATLGKATWSDTYLAPRSGGRKHEGQDLMGAKMLKLLAVVDGTIIIQLRDQNVVLGPGDVYVVPRGVEHCPKADTEASVLLFEPKGTINTGDAGGEMTAALKELDR